MGTIHSHCFPMYVYLIILITKLIPNTQSRCQSTTVDFSKLSKLSIWRILIPLQICLSFHCSEIIEQCGKCFGVLNLLASWVLSGLWQSQHQLTCVSIPVWLKADISPLCKQELLGHWNMPVLITCVCPVASFWCNLDSLWAELVVPGHSHKIIVHTKWPVF